MSRPVTPFPWRKGDRNDHRLLSEVDQTDSRRFVRVHRQQIPARSRTPGWCGSHDQIHHRREHAKIADFCYTPPSCLWPFCFEHAIPSCTPYFPMISRRYRVFFEVSCSSDQEVGR